MARRLGAIYGGLADRLLPDLRRRSRRHLRAAFPAWTRAEVEAVARGVPPWIGRAGADFLHLDRRRMSEVGRRLRVEGAEHWQTALGHGRGIVAVTGHFGNWELLGAWLASLGTPVTVLYHPFHEERLDRWVAQRRQRAGVQVLSAEQRGSAALRVLRRGEVLGVLVDRVPKQGGVPCRFFGQECRTAAGPARLALAAGAPILPVMLRYEGTGWLVRFSPPLQIAARAEVDAVTQRLTSLLEEWIREAPSQWPWFENRWKVRRVEVAV